MLANQDFCASLLDVDEDSAQLVQRQGHDPPRVNQDIPSVPQTNTIYFSLVSWKQEIPGLSSEGFISDFLCHLP